MTMVSRVGFEVPALPGLSIWTLCHVFESFVRLLRGMKGHAGSYLFYSCRTGAFCD